MSGVIRLFTDSAVAQRPTAADREAVRIAEALLFAATEPLGEGEISRHLPRDAEVTTVLAQLQGEYAARGIRLVRVGDRWIFRTADDLGWLFSPVEREGKKPSRAAMETLAIIAYHQPATRADVESIRGVAVAKGTMDVLMETGWVRPRGRRRTPGRPVTYVTTDRFLLQFGLESIGDLPGVDELRATGLLDEDAARRFRMPLPREGASDDEDLLDEAEVEAEADEGEPGDDLSAFDTPNNASNG